MTQSNQDYLLGSSHMMETLIGYLLSKECCGNSEIAESQGRVIKGFQKRLSEHPPEGIDLEAYQKGVDESFQTVLDARDIFVNDVASLNQKPCD